MKSSFTNKTSAHYGDTLGLMNPLPNKSYNYPFNSFNLPGDILLGEIVMGLVLGSISIAKKIYQSKSITGKQLQKIP